MAVPNRMAPPRPIATAGPAPKLFEAVALLSDGATTLLVGDAVEEPAGDLVGLEFSEIDILVGASVGAGVGGTVIK